MVSGVDVNLMGAIAPVDLARVLELKEIVSQ
jgi:hypothetical protein